MIARGPNDIIIFYHGRVCILIRIYAKPPDFLCVYWFQVKLLEVSLFIIDIRQNDLIGSPF